MAVFFTLEKEFQDFGPFVVGSLIFLCTPAPRSLPESWAASLDAPLAKMLLPTQKADEINTL